MPIVRDPKTGQLKVVGFGEQGGSLTPTRLPQRQERTLPQLPATQTPSQPAPTGSSFGRFVRGAGSLLKEVALSPVRALSAPLAIASEQFQAPGRLTVADIRAGRGPQQTPLSRFVFRDTDPGTRQRGFAALTSAAETASFLPVAGAFKPGLSLAQRAVRTALPEAGLGAAIGASEAGRVGSDIKRGALTGGLIGGAFGAALPVAGAGLGAAIRRVRPPRPIVPPPIRPISPGVLPDPRPTAQLQLPLTPSRQAPTPTAPIKPPRVEDVKIRFEPVAIAPEFRTNIVGRQGDEIGTLLDDISTGSAKALEVDTPKLERAFRELDIESPGLGGRTRDTLTRNIVNRNLARQRAREVAGIPQAITGKTAQIVSDSKKKLVDFTSPIENVVNKIERDAKVEFLPQRDIRQQFDRIFRSPSIANQFMRDEGFAGIATRAEKRGGFDELSELLIARRNEELRKFNPGIELGRSSVEDKLLIQSLQGKVGDLADEVNQYARRILDVAVDGGLVERKAAQQLKEQFPNYVPINRVFSVIEREGKFTAGGGGLGSVGKQTAVQSLKGSERAIQNPLQSLIERTQDVFLQSERNKAAQIMAGYRNLPNNPFGIRVLKAGENAAADKGSFDAVIQGVSQKFEIDREFASVIASSNPLQLGLLGKIIQMPTRVAKTGITGLNLPFAITNFVRDQLQGFVNSRFAFNTSINPLVIGRSIWSALKHDDLYAQAIRSGAITTSFDTLRNQAALSLSRQRGKSGAASALKHIVTNPKELISLLADSAESIISRGEEIRRLQEFIGTRKSFLAKGASKETADLLAANEARFVTANFHRRGEWGGALNAAFLYLNAGIQGARSTVRAFNKRPVKTTAKFVGGIALPVLSITAWNLKDPKRKQAYEDIPEFEKTNNLILLPPNPVKDENGKWDGFKIPLPQNLSGITGIFRRVMESSHDLDPVATNEIISGLLSTVSPVNIDITSKEDFNRSLANIAIPQAVKPLAQSAANFDFFTGAPIVPRKFQDLPAGEQIKGTTSGTAILIAQQIGSSPIKVEKFLQDTFGTVTKQVLNATDKAFSGAGVFANAGIPEDQIGGVTLPGEVRRRFSEVRGGVGESRFFERAQEIQQEAQADQRQKKLEAQGIIDQLSDLSTIDKNLFLANLRRNDPDLNEIVNDEIKSRKIELTGQERTIKSLGIKNGARAQFIFEQLQNLSNDESAEFQRTLEDKKIITRDVERQLRDLRNEQRGGVLQLPRR